MLTLGLSSAGISFIERHPITISAMTSMRMAIGRLMESLVSDIDLLTLLQAGAGDDHLIARLQPAHNFDAVARRRADPDRLAHRLAVLNDEDGRFDSFAR